MVPTLNHQTARGIGETMNKLEKIHRNLAEQLREKDAEIARLTRERDAARDALEPFAARVRDDGSIVSGRIPDDDLRQARAALSPSESPRP
jgi:chromosome segregation ATPase